MNINNDPINYIFKPEKLKPDILIVLSLEKTAKLIEFNSGKVIDSFKQMSINEIPFPIAVKYSINTPFGKEEPKMDSEGKSEIDDSQNKYSLTIPNENENQTSNKMKKKFPYIIYRKSIKYDKKPIRIKLNERHKKTDLL